MGGHYSQRLVHCERCEAGGAIQDIHEPFGGGLFWVHVRCVVCGFERIVRDDFHPEDERVIHDPGDGPPPKGLLWL